MEPVLNANNKRVANDGNDYPETMNNAKRTRSGKIDLRFLLASRDAGAIIGRQGKNIQTLRSKYKTMIQVPDQSGPERILTISGELEAALDCLTDALATMAGNQNLRQDANELRALVHNSQAGAVIGKRGEHVKELRGRHGLEVKVFPDTCPNSTDRVILCRGEQKAILNCLRDIFTQIETIPPRGPIHPYDPSCYAEHNIQRYGGFAADASSVYGDRRFRNHNSGGQKVGSSNNTSNNNNNNNYDNWDMNSNNMRNNHMYQNNYHSSPSNQNYYPPAPPPPGPMMPGNNNQGSMRPLIDPYNHPPAVQTQQVTIQNEYAGAIIGPRGTRISQIRQQSGASIKIDDPLPGSNDRIITIIGTPSQISQAQHLLQTAVRQSDAYRH